MESINQNCKTFMMIGNIPITLGSTRQCGLCGKFSRDSYKITCAVSLEPRKLSNHSPALKIPGVAAKRARTRSFIVVREKRYTASWRAQKLREGGDPYFPVSNPLRLHFSFRKNVRACRVKYMIATPVQNYVHYAVVWHTFATYQKSCQ